MQLIFISGSLRRSSLQVAGLTGFCNTFTQTFVPFPNIDSSLRGLNYIGYPDLDNIIASLKIANGKYTATEDCWCIGRLAQNDSINGASVSVDNIVMSEAYVAGNSNNTQILVIPIKKGQVVTTRQYGSYDISFYKILKN